MMGIISRKTFYGRRQLTDESKCLINSLEAEFGFRKRSTEASIIRELTDQLSRTLDSVFVQKCEENENRRLTQTNHKITELVTEFKQDIGRHIRPMGDYLSDHTMDKIIETKREHTINLFDAFAADDPDQLTNTKTMLLSQLESEGNVCKSNNSREVHELKNQLETITIRFKSQYDQEMNELFADQAQIYVQEDLDIRNTTIVSSLHEMLTQADVGTEVVPIEPYRQALDAYAKDKYRHYSDTNRMRRVEQRVTEKTILDNLNQEYEEALGAWIECTDTDDRQRFVDASRLIRTRIVTENTPIYRQQLNLKDLSDRFQATEVEMQDVLTVTLDTRRRAIDTIADRAIQWYRDEMDRASGDQTYILRHRLNEIHEGVVAGAVARFANDRGQLPMDRFTVIVSERLRLTYDSVVNENNRNAPTVPAIGIDLGTTNSGVACYIPGRTGHAGRIHVFRKNNTITTSEVTPSCVEYRDNGEVVVGEEAKDNLLANRRNTIYSAKRMIGRPFTDPDITRYNRDYWPFEVVDIDGAAGVEVEVDGDSRQHPVVDAVITVPAYFDDRQREVTRVAGVAAGLNVLAIINEPTAAALAYKLDRFKDASSRNVLIYDFGGKTFDVSVLKLSMNRVEVLAVGGDNHLGGDDLDNNVIDYCLCEFSSQTGVVVDRESAEGERAIRALRDRCEREKWHLSEATRVTIVVDKIADTDLKVVLTRSKFEQLNKELFDRTMDCVTNTLASANDGAGMTPDQIDDIVLVGGSTYIPYVKNMIKEYFNGRQPSQSVNPMLAVAEGAALQAAVLIGNQAYLQQYLQVLDVTPRTLGVRERGNRMSPIIPAQSRVDGIPRTKVYTTVCDNQTEIEVNVYEGEDLDVVTNNTLLGRFVVMNIPPDEAGKQNVSIEFCVNGDGILKVKAKVLSGGTVTEHEVHKYTGRLSPEELVQRRHRQDLLHA